MKKSLKKLTLSRETLSLLASEQLNQAAGAGTSGDGEFASRCADCAPKTWTSVKACY